MLSELERTPLFDTVEYLTKHFEDECQKCVLFARCQECDHYKFYYYTPLFLSQERLNLGNPHQSCQECIHFKLALERQGKEETRADSAWLLDIFQSVKSELPIYTIKEYFHVISFLYNYRGNQDSFNAYRREMERFLQWSWFVCQKGVLTLKSQDIEAFIKFCENPPKSWVGLKTVSRFLEVNGQRVPNPEWRPFNFKVHKKNFPQKENLEEVKFELSKQGVKQIISVLGAFYNAMIQTGVIESDPLPQIRFKYKSSFQPLNKATEVRKISESQWQTILEMAQQLSKKDPRRHNRTLFIMQALYRMGLGVSNLVSSKSRPIKMSDFFQDLNGKWWFKAFRKDTLCKIPIDHVMLDALKAYREHLGYTSLPTPCDQTPLIPKKKGAGPVESTRIIRQIVQSCFEEAVEHLKKNGQFEEANNLHFVTTSWLHHKWFIENFECKPEGTQDVSAYGCRVSSTQYKSNEKPQSCSCIVMEEIK